MQENQLTTIEKLPLSEMMTIAKLFAESGMFTDATSQAKAVVKIMAGAEIGIPAFAAMSGIHIIVGKPTIGAGLIAARVKGSGKYDYKVTEQTEKVCSIDFYQGKDKIGTSTFTIEDAKKAGTKNIDKFPKNMLFARAISNGVKWYCPDVFSGPVYVPEEMETTIDVPHTVVGETTILPPTPQPQIDVVKHAINAIKKRELISELKSDYERMTLEVQSSPLVTDEMRAKLFEFISATITYEEQATLWTAIGTIGKDKEWQKDAAMLKKMKEHKEKLTTKA